MSSSRAAPSENCNVQVFVRVRPFNDRERKLDSNTIPALKVVGRSHSGTAVRMLKTDVGTAEVEDESATYVCDDCFWSVDNSATQQTVFDHVGVPCVEHVWEGFNACIFAYGQTGSGKTHTMSGVAGDVGLIPRMTHSLVQELDKLEEGEFERAGSSIAGDSIIAGAQDDPRNRIRKSFTLTVRYFEIYNEQAFDLLVADSKPLRVREHPLSGPFVADVTEIVVSSEAEMAALLDRGARHRHTATTQMNDKSSRSHSVFQVELTQTTTILPPASAPATTKPNVVKRQSRLNLVDLAGSENAKKTGAMGDTAKEGQNINKSLLTLGKVIDALLEKQMNPHTKGIHIPYRDSTLTFLLKESLGGNSRTVMLATVSPARDNWAETKNTLTYAARARKLVNTVHVVEDEVNRVINSLKDENEKLRVQLKEQQHNEALSQQLERNQALIDELRAREEASRADAELREKELLIRHEQNATVRKQLEDERDKMKREAEQKQQDLLRRNEQIMMLEERVQEYEEKLRKEKDELRKTFEQYEALMSDHSKVKGQMAAITQHKEEMQRMVRQAEFEMLELRIQNEVEEKKLKEATDELAERDKKLRELQTNTEMLNQQAKLQTQKLDEQAAALERQQQDLLSKEQAMRELAQREQ
eukprot:PhM_4_TR12911/c0_g1_i1/m.53215/K17914/KIF13; kinesin family member 13